MENKLFFIFIFCHLKVFYIAIVCTGIMSKVKKKLPTMNHSKIRDKLIVKASVIRGYLCIFHYAFYFVKVKNDALIREKKKGRERE